MFGVFTFSLSSFNSFEDASQDCHEYASNAADEEVGAIFWYTVFNSVWYESYNWYHSFCEGTNLNGGTALEPVFIETN